MKYHIKIDALDPDSIDDGLRLLQLYKKEEMQKILFDFPQLICEKAVEAANVVYDGFATATWRFRGANGNGMVASIEASGREICFIEFGTGDRVAEDHPFADFSRLGFWVYPGSWSIEHEKTYQDWVEKGKPGEYKYEIIPHKGMLAAYYTIIYALEDVAREVFIDD